MAHDHDHSASPHPESKDHPVRDWEGREAAIRALLIEKGVLEAGEIRRKIENGSRSRRPWGRGSSLRPGAIPPSRRGSWPMPMLRRASSASMRAA